MLKTRILTAAVLLLLCAATVFLGRVYFIFLVLAFFVVASSELARLIKVKNTFLFSLASAIGLVSIWILDTPIVYVGLIASMLWLSVLFPLLFRSSSQISSKWHGGVFLLCLIAAFHITVSFFDQNGLTLVAILAIAWCADTGAYFSGRVLGKHKLAPSISSGKTWEGVLGGVITVFLLVWGLNSWPPAQQHLPSFMNAQELAPHWIALICLLLCASCVLGDLFESKLKRQAGVKDSGTILPGHGGVLDRIDAWIPLLTFAAVCDSLF